MAGATAAALALLGSAGAAEAADFSVIHSSADEVTVIDPAAIETVAGGLRRAVTVTVQKNLVSGGAPQPGYVRTLNEYDCQQRQMRWKSVAAYSRFGAQLLKKDNASADWTANGDDVDARPAFRVVCDGDSVGQVYTASSIGRLVLALMQAWDQTTPLPPLQAVRPLPRKPGHGGKPPSARTR
ncbi:MAG: surface-adhesin E family protein [Phenylobacterium sp.]